MKQENKHKLDEKGLSSHKFLKKKRDPLKSADLCFINVNQNSIAGLTKGLEIKDLAIESISILHNDAQTISKETLFSFIDQSIKAGIQQVTIPFSILHSGEIDNFIDVVQNKSILINITGVPASKQETLDQKTIIALQKASPEEKEEKVEQAPLLDEPPSAQPLAQAFVAQDDQVAAARPRVATSRTRNVQSQSVKSLSTKDDKQIFWTGNKILGWLKMSASLFKELEHCLNGISAKQSNLAANNKSFWAPHAAFSESAIECLSKHHEYFQYGLDIYNLPSGFFSEKVSGNIYNISYDPEKQVDESTQRLKVKVRAPLSMPILTFTQGQTLIDLLPVQEPAQNYPSGLEQKNFKQLFEASGEYYNRANKLLLLKHLPEIVALEKELVPLLEAACIEDPGYINEEILVCLLNNCDFNIDGSLEQARFITGLEQNAKDRFSSKSEEIEAFFSKLISMKTQASPQQVDAEDNKKSSNTQKDGYSSLISSDFKDVEDVQNIKTWIDGLEGKEKTKYTKHLFRMAVKHPAQLAKISGLVYDNTILAKALLQQDSSAEKIVSVITKIDAHSCKDLFYKLLDKHLQHHQETNLEDMFSCFEDFITSCNEKDLHIDANINLENMKFESLPVVLSQMNRALNLVQEKAHKQGQLDELWRCDFSLFSKGKVDSVYNQLKDAKQHFIYGDVGQAADQLKEEIGFLSTIAKSKKKKTISIAQARVVLQQISSKFDDDALKPCVKRLVSESIAQTDNGVVDEKQYVEDVATLVTKLKTPTTHTGAFSSQINQKISSSLIIELTKLFDSCPPVNTMLDVINLLMKDINSLGITNLSTILNISENLLDQLNRYSTHLKINNYGSATFVALSSIKDKEEDFDNFLDKLDVVHYYKYKDEKYKADYQKPEIMSGISLTFKMSVIRIIGIFKLSEDEVNNGLLISLNKLNKGNLDDLSRIDVSSNLAADLDNSHLQAYINSVSLDAANNGFDLANTTYIDNLQVNRRGIAEYIALNSKIANRAKEVFQANHCDLVISSLRNQMPENRQKMFDKLERIYKELSAPKNKSFSLILESLKVISTREEQLEAAGLMADSFSKCVDLELLQAAKGKSMPVSAQILKRLRELQPEEKAQPQEDIPESELEKQVVVEQVKEVKFDEVKGVVHAILLNSTPAVSQDPDNKEVALSAPEGKHESLQEANPESKIVALLQGQAFAAFSPEVRKSAFKLVEQTCKDDSSNVLPFIVNIKNYILTSDESGVDNNAALLVSEIFNGQTTIGSETINQQSLQSVFSALEGSNASQNDKKIIFQTICKLINNGLFKIQESDFNTVVTDFIKSAEKNMVNFTSAYDTPPYPSNIKFASLIRNKDDFDTELAVFDKLPYGQDHREDDEVHGNKFDKDHAACKQIDATAEVDHKGLLAKACAGVRKKTTLNLQEEIKAENVTVYTKVANVAELLYRSTGSRINTTQYVAILNNLLTTHNLTNIATGEGKSRINMILNAILSTGSRSDAKSESPVISGQNIFITSDFDLAQRDFLEFQSFFEICGIKSALLTSDSSLDDLENNHLVFFDKTGWGLFLSKMYSTHSKAKVDLVLQAKNIVLDEADELLYQSDPYNIAVESQSQHSIEWMYDQILDFVKSDSQDFKSVLSSSDATALQQDQANNFPPEKLTALINSAKVAVNLEFGRDYAIESDDFKSNVLVISEGQTMSKESKYAGGVHQFLIKNLSAQQKSLREILDAKHKEGSLEERLLDCPEFEFTAQEMVEYSLKPHELIGMFKTVKAVTGSTGDNNLTYELRQRYSDLRVSSLASHKTLDRTKNNAKLSEGSQALIAQVSSEIKTLRDAEDSRPVLVVTDNDDTFCNKMKDELSGAARSINSETSSADHSDIIKNAGKENAITVAVAGRAGRGVHISPFSDEGSSTKGLVVILTYVPTYRIYQQIIGRCARQGQPGEVIVCLNTSVKLLKNLTATQFNQLKAAVLANNGPAVITTIGENQYKTREFTAQEASEIREFVKKQPDLQEISDNLVTSEFINLPGQLSHADFIKITKKASGAPERNRLLLQIKDKFFNQMYRNPVIQQGADNKADNQAVLLESFAEFRTKVDNLWAEESPGILSAFNTFDAKCDQAQSALSAFKAKTEDLFNTFTAELLSEHGIECARGPSSLSINLVLEDWHKKILIQQNSSVAAQMPDDLDTASLADVCQQALNAEINKQTGDLERKVADIETSATTINASVQALNQDSDQTSLDALIKQIDGKIDNIAPLKANIQDKINSLNTKITKIQAVDEGDRTPEQTANLDVYNQASLKLNNLMSKLTSIESNLSLNKKVVGFCKKLVKIMAVEIDNLSINSLIKHTIEIEELNNDPSDAKKTLNEFISRLKDKQQLVKTKLADKLKVKKTSGLRWSVGLIVLAVMLLYAVALAVVAIQTAAVIVPIGAITITTPYLIAAVLVAGVLLIGAIAWKARQQDKAVDSCQQQIDDLQIDNLQKYAPPPVGSGDLDLDPMVLGQPQKLDAGQQGKLINNKTVSDAGLNNGPG